MRLAHSRLARARRRADREHPHRHQVTRRHHDHPARPAASLREPGLAPAGVRAARGRGRAGGAQGHRPARHGPLAHPGAWRARAGAGLRLRPAGAHGQPRRPSAPDDGALASARACLRAADRDRQHLAFEPGAAVEDWQAGGRVGAQGGRKKAWRAVRERAGSFCVETDIHHPTDADLLRAAVRTAARLADGLRLDGWCQHEHLSRRAEKRSDRVRTSRRNKSPPERMEQYLSLCRRLAGRAEAMLAYELEGYLGHARGPLDQVSRRLLGGETIPHGEKVLSIFDPHTR